MSRMTEDLLGLLVAESHDYAIFMLDVDGIVASWNAGAERFKGYQAEEIIGRHFSVFYPPEDIGAGKPGRELEIAASDGRLEDEGWRVRKDGSCFWANVVITPLRDSDGRLRGFGKVTRDLTERRTRELEVLASEKRLRLMVENVLELHEGVVQGLVVAKLELDLNQIEATREALNGAFERARTIVSTSLEELRREGTPLTELLGDPPPTS
jgi:PAS domain S-box-containing protein